MNIARITRGLGLIAAAAALTTLAACGGGNAGGDTTCADYKAASGSQRTEIITKFLEDKGKDPNNLEINLNKASALAFCNTLGGDDDPISKIDG